MTRLVLASQSPRRAELLRQIGVDFDVAVADIDETPGPGEAVARYVARMAREKAWAVAASHPARPVLAADTVVEVDGEILGKPRDRRAAARMLGRLSARAHRVWSSVALCVDGGTRQAESCTEVRFRALEASEIAAYWETGEPRDKAGGYAIQGLGAVFVREIMGSYSGVMGLPLFETAGLLRTVGIDPLIVASESKPHQNQRTNAS